MASGFFNGGGVDLDNIFEPYAFGAQVSATGFRLSNGADLSGRYAALAMGSQASSTGLKIGNGADLNTLWAAKGSVGYPQLLSGSYTASGYGNAVFALEPDGTIFHVSGSPSQPNWISPHIGMSNYQVFATKVSQSGSGSFAGIYNTWLSLGSLERSWKANRASGSGPGTDSLVIDLSIRRVSDLAVVTSARISLFSTN